MKGKGHPSRAYGGHALQTERRVLQAVAEANAPGEGKQGCGERRYEPLRATQAPLENGRRTDGTWVGLVLKGKAMDMFDINKS